MPPLRRRTLLGAALWVSVLGGGAAGLESGLLPGRTAVYAKLGLNGPRGVPLPAASPGPLVRGSFASRARGTRVGWAVAYPPGVRPGTPLPLLVALHGRGDNHAAIFGARLGLDRFLAAGGHRYAVAAVDGGVSYWHPRHSGEDAGAMVVEEFLPMLARRGLGHGRIGFYGYSMGGYGGLRLAGLLGPDRVAAVAAVSAALFASAAEIAPGSFDGPADFAAHDVHGRQDELKGIAVRLDCGRGDLFLPANRRYRRGFPEEDRPSGEFGPGGHDLDYWRRTAPGQLDFLARHLTP